MLKQKSPEDLLHGYIDYLHKYLDDHKIYYDKVVFEIGAHTADDTELNVISYIKKGYKTYLFEPHPKLFEEIKKNRKEDNVIKLELAVGNENKNVILFEGKDGPLNDYAHTTYDIENNYGITVDVKYTVKMKTLKSIVKKYNIKKNILLMYIDTEGTDLQVIQSNDFNNLQPKIIITEWHSCSSLIGSKYLDTKIENDLKHNLLIENPTKRLWG